MRNRTLSLGILLLLSLGGSGPASAAADPASSLERTLLPATVLEGVKPWSLAERMRRHHVPGVSIAVIEGGQVAWAKSWGVLDAQSGEKVTPRSLFQAGSISTAVTALAVLRLADQGKLDLDAPVNSLLRSWKLPQGPLTPGVTVARVLGHTGGLTVAGFPGYDPGARLPTLLQTLNGQPPANTPPVRCEAQPGASLGYSAGGYEVLEQLLVDVTGQSFEALVRDTVLGPAAMEDSTFQQPLTAELAARAAAGHTAEGKPLPGHARVYPELAAAGLWTTATDLARLAIAVQRSRAGAEGALLSRARATRMLTATVDFSGLGFLVDQRGPGTFEQLTAEQPAGTGGFKALVVASTEGGYGLAVMTNGEGGAPLADEILRGAAQLYGWKEFTPPRVKGARLSAGQLRALAGRYRLGSDEVLVFEAGAGVLRGRPLLGEPFELYPVAADAFLRLDPPGRYLLDGAGLEVETPFGEDRGPRLEKGETVPLEMLLGGNVPGALAAYRRLRQFEKGDPAISEARLNELGYELLPRAGDKALGIFRLNTEFYPNSANTWDSLGEALLGTGKKAEALECYRKVVELLSRDSTLPSTARVLIRLNAEAKVRELEGR
jgi:CubicO group peptidase (beta-lactamase class C family)